MALSSFKTQAARQQAIADYEAQLAKKIEVDRINSEAIGKYYRRTKFAAPAPPPGKVKTAAEEIADQSLQRDIAYNTLKKIMKDADASTVLFSVLNTHDDIVEFNRFSSSFMRSVAGQKNITPEYFGQLWDRFKEKLIRTGRTDIPIGVEQKEYEEDVKAIEAGLRLLARPKFKKEGIESKQLGKDVERITRLKETLVSSPMDFIENLFLDKIDQEMNLGLMDVREGDWVEIPSDDGKTMERYNFGLYKEEFGEAKFIENSIHSPNGYTNLTLIYKDDDGDEHVFQGPSGPIRGILPRKKIQYIIYRILGFPYGEPIHFDRQKKIPHFTRKGAMEHRDDPVEIVEEAREAAEEDRMSEHSARTSIEDEDRMSARTIATPSRELFEKGLRATSPSSGSGVRKARDRLKPVFYKIGAGINTAQRPHKNRFNRQPNFGNYCISITALQKGFLTLQYPSGAAVPQFRKQLISSDLHRIISDILFDNKFEESSYQKLEETEKKLFDDLIRFAKLDVKDNLLLYRHKKYYDDEHNRDVNRFNLLRGELIAGNDSPEIIKELKSLLFKLSETRSISRADYNIIMRKIMTLV